MTHATFNKKNLGECASDESTWTGHRHPSLICGLSRTFWEPPDPLILLLHVVKRNNYGWFHSCFLKNRFDFIAKNIFVLTRFPRWYYI